MKRKLSKLLFTLFTVQLFLTVLFAQEEQKAELVIQTGHTSFVRSVAFSPNGKILASGSDDTAIKLWDAASGQELRTLTGHNDSVRSVAFSPDGKILASGGGNVLNPESKRNTIKLWNVASGKELYTFAGHDSYIESIAFSPDGRILASASYDNTIKLWDTITRQELRTIKGHTSAVTSVAFSPNGKTLASGSYDNTIKLWDVTSGQQLHTFRGHTDIVSSVTFSPDGKTLVSGGQDKTIKVWNTITREQLKTLEGHSSSIWSVAFSPNGKFLVSGSLDNTIKIWDVASGQQQKTLEGHTGAITSVVFSPNGEMLLSGSQDKTIKLWDFTSGQELRTFKGHTSEINTVVISPDGTIIASGGWDNTIKLLELITRREPRILKGHTDAVTSVAFSPDGKTLVSGSRDNTVKLWDMASEKEIRTIQGHNLPVISVAFSTDGKTIASGSEDKTIKLWDVASGLEIRNFEGHTSAVTSVAFSPDSTILASGDGNVLDLESNENTIKLWNVASGKEIRTLQGHNSYTWSLAFSTTGKMLASGNHDNKIKLWDMVTGKLLTDFQGNDPKITAKILTIIPDFYKKSDFEPITKDEKFQIKRSINGKLQLTEVISGNLLASLLTLNEKDWVVITPEGLFDASPNARKLMHYIIGLEPIALEQMKDLYYVPGLLQKIFNGEPLPKVELFSKKDLFPEVEFSQPKPGQKELNIKLKNRGGGIGQVQILINGKEFIADVRDEKVKANPNVPEAKFTVSLKDAPFIAGKENKIEVIARNLSGSLTNRGTRGGSELVVFEEDKPQKPTPNIYIIAGGISNYTGDNLDLSFAAKDAEDIAKALELGAVNLFGGDKSKVHIRLLTSNGANANVKFDVPDAKISTATKADFQKAFAEFSGATTDDVFIVYLAGHGISLNLNQDAMQAGGNTYLYLTQEATTTDKSFLFLKQSREAMSVSAEELKELMKQNKALKQVLILDTCAAGAISDSLVGKRDEVPADQILAIERLKDSTGFYVLMGSSADSVSYEATQFGQGLLTYSLLSAFKGGKLSGGDIAEVEEIFAFAKKTVPQLAKNIGGIQEPKTITPDASDIISIGRFPEDVQDKIILTNPKPIFVRPSLRNAELKYDNLKLTKMLTDRLRAASYAMKRGEQSRIVYFEADEITDAVQPVGDYRVEGDTLHISVILVKNNKPKGEKITVSGKANEPEKVIGQLVQAIIMSE